MDKKTHGPAFRRVLKPLMVCSSCRGAGCTEGIFHQIACWACNASGWVCQSTGNSLPLDELVAQLNIKLRNASAELSRAKQANGGAHEQYEKNNRRGAGGSNYTGD